MHIIELAPSIYLKDGGGQLPVTGNPADARNFNTLKQANRALTRLQKQRSDYPDAKAVPAKRY